MTEILQKAFMKGSRRFALPGDGTIQCEYRHGRSFYRFAVKLGGLDPNSRQDRFFATGMLVGSVILGTPAVGMLIGAMLSKPASDARIVFAVFCVLLSLFALMCILGLLKQSYRLLVFPNPTNANDSIVLFVDSPDKEQFNRFVADLNRQIMQARESPVGIGGSLATEIRELLKLKDEGVLTESEFQKAKTKLIEGSHEANKALHATSEPVPGAASSSHEG